MTKKCIVHLLLCFKYPEFYQLPIGPKFSACSLRTRRDKTQKILFISLIFLLRKRPHLGSPRTKLLSSTKKTVFSEFTYPPGRGLLSTEVIINQYLSLHSVLVVAAQLWTLVSSTGPNVLPAFVAQAEVHSSEDLAEKLFIRENDGRKVS